MRIISIVNKMTDLISKVSKIKNKRNRLCSALSVTAMVITVMIVLQSLYSPAYAITMNGERIGVVADPAVYEQAVVAVEAKATDILGEEYKLEDNTDMSMTLVAKEELVSANDIEASLLNQVDEIQESYVMKVDGVTIGASEDGATARHR